MAGSTLDPDNVPARRSRKTQKGHDVRSLGPSDSSDSGSDLVGRRGRDDTSDRSGTGERLTADPEQTVRPGADIDADRIVDADEAGLGQGLDEAEEALLDPEDERADRS
jgi:hypothetical protein